jgi:hypothetical protein
MDFQFWAILAPHGSKGKTFNYELLPILGDPPTLFVFRHVFFAPGKKDKTFELITEKS